MSLLSPHDLELVLTNRPEYQDAKQLLWLDWDEDPNQLYHHQVAPAVVRLARALQHTGLIQGRVNLTDYRAVSQLVGMHALWFSNGAKAELLKPFEA